MIWGCLGRCCRPVPQRFVVATMVLLGLAVQYVDRLSFNLAITEIAYKEVEEEEEDEFAGSCPFNESGDSVDPNLRAEFYWTPQEQANLIGSFYFGYIVTQLPGGLLSDWYGPKRVMGLSTLLSGVCVILTPLCARLTRNTWALLANRVALGMVQGPLFPAISSFTARWSTPKERNIMSSYMNMGINVGAITSNMGTGFLLYYLDSWDTMFYLYGVLTLLFSVAWHLFVHDSPSNHPFITEEERNKMVDSLKNEVMEGRNEVPIRAMMKSVPVWAMIMANVGHDWKFYIVISLLPQYISYVLHMDVFQNGMINCGPYLSMFVVSMVSGKLAGLVLKRGWMSKTMQCKVWTVIANMTPCVFFILATFGGCNRIVAVACFVLAFSFVGFAYASVRVVNVHLAPNYAGLLMSVSNAIGCLCGMMGPKVFAYFTEQQSVQGWRAGFIVSFAIVGTVTLIFVIFGSADLQPWNDPTPRSSLDEPPGEEPANKNK